LRTGEELDRKCEFAAALKYYYAGKVYYSKLDEFRFQLHGCDASEIINGFEENRDGFYATMCSALKEIAEQNKDWSERHPGILLGPWCGTVDENIQLLHLKHSLCPGDAQPSLDTVRQNQLPSVSAKPSHSLQVLHNAAKKLGVHFHLNILAPGAVQSSDPQIVIFFKDSEFSWSFPEKESDEKKKHEDLRNRFEQLFERLLPYSNKEVSCRAYSICALPHASNLVFRLMSKPWKRCIFKRLY
jgi:hypothetical protein